MEISKDQNTVTASTGDHRAIAYVEDVDNCARCAFYGDQSECAEAPCMEWERTDGRSVIFIKSE